MNPHRRNAAVDGLKGIAIIIVILHHFVLAYYPAIIAGYPSLINTKQGIELIIFKSPLSLLFAGYFAVSLFFLITGYVLTKKVISIHEEERQKIAKSIYTRIFRLMPLIAVVLFVGYIFMNLHLTYNVKASLYTKSSWFASFFPLGKVSFQTLISEILTKIPFVTSARYYNVLWIIPSILFGSWLVYTFSYFFHKSVYKWGMYFILLLAFYNGHYISFVLGMIIAENEEQLTPHLFIVYCGLILSILFGSSTIKALDIKQLAPFSNIVKSLSAAFFFIACKNIDWLKRIAEHKILVYLGENSYYYFLTHMLALISLPTYLFLLIIPGGRYFYGVLLTLCVYLLCTIIYSEVLKKFEGLLMRKG